MEIEMLTRQLQKATLRILFSNSQSHLIPTSIYRNPKR